MRRNYFYTWLICQVCCGVLAGIHSLVIPSAWGFFFMFAMVIFTIAAVREMRK